LRATLAGESSSFTQLIRKDALHGISDTGFEKKKISIGFFKKTYHSSETIYIYIYFEPYINAPIANMFGDVMFDPIFGITVAVG